MTPARVAALALIAITGTATAGQAQFPGGAGSPRLIQLVISGGMTLPAGDLGDFHDAGFHYDASLILNLPGFPIALRPEFSLTQFKLKETAGGGTVDGDVTQMMAAMGNIELPLGGGLYVLAGGGLLSLSTPGTGTSDISQSKLTFEAGAGLRFGLGAVRGFLEARIGSASYDQGKFGFSKAQFIPLTFGLVF